MCSLSMHHGVLSLFESYMIILSQGHSSNHLIAKYHIPCSLPFWLSMLFWLKSPCTLSYLVTRLVLPFFLIGNSVNWKRPKCFTVCWFPWEVSDWGNFRVYTKLTFFTLRVSEDFACYCWFTTIANGVLDEMWK